MSPFFSLKTLKIWINSKFNNLINLKLPKKLSRKKKANGETETLYTRLLRNTKQSQWLLRQLRFQYHNIVTVKHGTALHPRSLKANQGRPKESKGCPCSNPGNCLQAMSSFLGGYQLSQSTMVSYTFLPYPSSSCKYKRRERAMFNIQHSPRV